LGIAILVVAIIFGTSLDLKKMQIPKTIQIFSVNQLMISVNTILIGYLVLNISSMEYYVMENVI